MRFTSKVQKVRGSDAKPLGPIAMVGKDGFCRECTLVAFEV